MPDHLVVTTTLTIPAHELSWRFSRSGGPGGQSVNTADSRVQLSFDVVRSAALTPPHRERAMKRLADRLVDGVVTVSASEHRAQRRNRDAALRRLAELLRAAVAAPAPPRRPTAPSRGAQRRREAARIRRSRVKDLRRRPID